MPHEPAPVGPEGTVLCSWCFQKRYHKECVKYKSNWFCVECVPRLSMGSVMRCARCRNMVPMPEMYMDRRQGKFYCRGCWVLVSKTSEECVDQEFLKNCSQPPVEGEPRK